MEKAALEPSLKEREQGEALQGQDWALGWGPKLSRKKPNVSLGLRKDLEQGLKQGVTAGAPGVS